MPVINRTLLRTFSPRPSLVLEHCNFSTTPTASRDSQFRRSDFSGQGFTGSYEPGAPTVGPLSQASKHGAPRFTPSMLKEHLDKFVVGQDKAKKVTSVAVYNHYQRIREWRRQEAEEQERREQIERRLLAERERNSHPVENEFPGHVETVDPDYRFPISSGSETELGSTLLSVPTQTVIEKSNLLLLGPSGVGKTYILSTLARILEVPFATIDCSALTQAGYIGTDIESSIERLLLASNFDISKCESGIIFFDEVDKLAKPAIMTHGRDVSGEGVQQGLLKMIEGTSVTVNAKSDRSSKTDGNSRGSDRIDRGGRDGSTGSSSGKNEQYTIDTSNILFVFAGAFVGLDRIVTSRLSSGTSIGFGAVLKTQSSSSYLENADSLSFRRGQEPINPLLHVLPSDLQTYGLIPEILGRIPIITSLHPLSLSQLVSILTEPKNSLVKQYTALFSTYGIQLKFTTSSLHAIGERSFSASSTATSTSGKGRGVVGSIGARGLRSILESVLGEIMFWGPGSSIRYCLIDETFVRGYDEGYSQFKTKEEFEGANAGDGQKTLPRCWSRGQGTLFEEAWEREEEIWRIKEEEREKIEREVNGEGESVKSFEHYREVGSSGM